MKDTRELIIKLFPADVPVNPDDRAVIKYYGIAEGIAYLLAEDIQIIMERLRMELRLRQKRYAAVQIAVKLVRHCVGNLIQHLRYFFKFIHNSKKEY